MLRSTRTPANVPVVNPPVDNMPLTLGQLLITAYMSTVPRLILRAFSLSQMEYA
jgi:hypothetical protein